MHHWHTMRVRKGFAHECANDVTEANRARTNVTAANRGADK